MHKGTLIGSPAIIKFISILNLLLALIAILVLNFFNRTSPSDAAALGMGNNNAPIPNNPSTISLSLLSDQTAKNIPVGGGIARINHRVLVQAKESDYPLDWRLGVSSNSSNYHSLNMMPTVNNTDSVIIKPVKGTIDSPVELADLTYGYNAWRADPTGPVVDTVVDKYAGLSTLDKPTTIMTGQTNPVRSGLTAVEVNWGVRVDNPTIIPADTYSVYVKYTLIADEVIPSPVVGHNFPDVYELGNERSMTIHGFYLETASEVYIGEKGDMPDKAGACAIKAATKTSIECELPDLAVGRYNVYVTTKGGTTSGPFSIIQYTYNHQICRNGDGVSACRVDIDDGMIPVTYAGNEPDGRAIWVKADINNPGDWYDYGQKKWANAVTIVNPNHSYRRQSNANVLRKYEQGAPGIKIESNDILAYFVYIPRYAYEVMRPNGSDRMVSYKQALDEGGFQIRFESVADRKKIPSTSCNKLNPTMNQMWQNGTADNVLTNILAKDYRTQCGINRTYRTGDGANSDPRTTTWSTHPGFSWAYTRAVNGFDRTTELNGIWVGKFETTGSRTAPTIKPNQHGKAMEFIGTQYDMAKSVGVVDNKNIYGGSKDNITLGKNLYYLSKTKSHAMKNTEWGMVTYLTASKYGIGVKGPMRNAAFGSANSTDVDGVKFSYSITGCGPYSATDGSSKAIYKDGTTINKTTIESLTACSKDKKRAYNGSIGQLASTTGNIYGIYDMAGGLYEVMMANVSDNATQATISDKDYMKTPPKPPYVDLYPLTKFKKPAWSASKAFERYAIDACDYASCGGQGVHELLNDQSAGGPRHTGAVGSMHWGSGNALQLPNGKSRWQYRGNSVNYHSDIYDGTYMGLSNSYPSTYKSPAGYKFMTVGFRIVMADY